MKIGFCGTMSVGKTTLVNALKELPEFKQYEFRTERSKYLRDLGIPLNTDSTIKGQTVFLAERAAELFKENIITDRTIVDVMAFTHLAKSISYISADKFEAYASEMLREYDIIFYVSPKGVEIEDNGVRETNEDYRKKVDKKINQILNKYSHKIRKLVKIEGSIEERIKIVQEQLPSTIFITNTVPYNKL
jgi:nicotinamide riboside kinase